LDKIKELKKEKIVYWAPDKSWRLTKVGTTMAILVQNTKEILSPFKK